MNILNDRLYSLFCANLQKVPILVEDVLNLTMLLVRSLEVARLKIICYVLYKSIKPTTNTWKHLQIIENDSKKKKKTNYMKKDNIYFLLMKGE